MGRFTVPVIVAALVVTAGFVVAMDTGSILDSRDTNEPNTETDETAAPATTDDSTPNPPGQGTPVPGTPGQGTVTPQPEQTLVAGGDGGDGGGVANEAASYDSAAPTTSKQNVGVSVGGAQDANNFRRNVENGYVPPLRTMTHEGLFHDYFFDTGMGRECTERFCPSYSRAVTRDPLSEDPERFVTVGLNSGITQAEFERPALDVVVVVDTSGSMGSSFSDYYYDGGERQEVDSEQTKMAAASDAVTTLNERLGDDDRLGVVAYSNTARVVQDFENVSDIDETDLRSRVRSLEASGGTNLAAGRSRALEQLRDVDSENDSRATRVIYVTDAMPNLGTTDDGTLRSRLQDDASHGVHSTFVGVGVDFNAQLVDSLSDVRGANYYSVNSPSEFDERMDEGFQYMVTPLAYDLRLSLEDSDAVDRVYGTPGGDGASAGDGELLNVTTLFPSRSEGNKSEGSVILLKVDDDHSGPITLNASYETPAGEKRSVTREVTFRGQSAPYYETTGVRKAVVLTRYTNLLQNWASHEHMLTKEDSKERPETLPAKPDDGIEYVEYDGQWEQESLSLRVTPPYDERIEAFEDYFQSEAEALDSDRFDDDLSVLDRLTNESTPNDPEPPREPVTPADPLPPEEPRPDRPLLPGE